MKQKHPYTSFLRRELILRDLLAIDRTVLANERTLLSYLRTALALVAAGVSIIKFLPTAGMNVFAWILVASGIAFFVVGLWKYFRMHHMIAAVRKEAHLPPEEPTDH